MAGSSSPCTAGVGARRDQPARGGSYPDSGSPHACNQFRLPLDAPPLDQARAAGAAAGELARGKAERLEPGFTERAREHILATLQRLGTASGEYLTDACIGAGIKAPDARAFGSVFASMSRAGLIRCLRSDLPRARGHGTSGGKLWGLA